MQEFATLAAPVAPLTWEVSELLPGAQLETGRLPLEFRGPVEILGCYPSVINIAVSNPALRIATLDDLLVAIDIDQEEKITNRLEQGGNATQGVSYVTLGALGTARAQRWLRKKLQTAKPSVGVMFRWKIDPAGAAKYEDTLVSLAFFCRYLDKGE